MRASNSTWKPPAEGVITTTYEFTLVLANPPELTEEVSDKLFAGGCDDGSPGTCSGAFSNDFHRDAPTLESAIGSAIADVAKAGFEVERVEIRVGALPVSA